MARARNIKPGFFQNENLVEYPFEVRLLFIGLWTLADKKGRLEDRPKKIKMGVFPADDVNVEKGLVMLCAGKFIDRYTVGGVKYIQITNWEKHQSPHHTEKDSVIPPVSNGEEPVEPQKQDGGNPPDSLIHRFSDSLIPDSLIPDSPKEPKSNPSQPAAPAAPKKKVVSIEDTALQVVCRETWAAYRDAYTDRYSVGPVRNAKVSGQVKSFCKRVPAEEAPGIAAFFVRHNSSFYVGKGHAVGLLLADAEKLRTEWATNQTITQTQAQQADKTQANGNVWGKVIAGIEERERNAAVN